MTVQPREVLISVDHTCTGHSWKLVNEQPWIRAYVIFQTGADLHLSPIRRRLEREPDRHLIGEECCRFCASPNNA